MEIKLSTQLAAETQSRAFKYLPPSALCKTEHTQACFTCDDASCGDNKTPSIIELRGKLAEAKAEVARLKQRLENWENHID